MKKSKTNDWNWPDWSSGDLQVLIEDYVLTLEYSLTGFEGTNRCERPPLIKARHDGEAISAWLSCFEKKSATWKSYSKEALRLLLWASCERKTAISSLTLNDFTDYLNFLRDPDPSWINANPVSKQSSEWRPLRGPLSVASLTQTQVILKRFCTWMVQAQYFATNPFHLMPKIKQKVDHRQHRYLKKETWLFLRSWLSKLPENNFKELSAKVRVIHLCHLLYLTAARLSDVTQAKMGDFIQEDNHSWWWRVEGKGSKIAYIPVTPELLDSIKKYRRFWNLSDYPSPAEKLPLIFHLHGPTLKRKPLSGSMIYRILKDVFQQASQQATHLGLTDISIGLKDASTHWMRHTSLTHQLQAGVDLITVRDNARHASIATTSRYLWGNDKLRYQTTRDQFKLNPLLIDDKDE